MEDLVRQVNKLAEELETIGPMEIVAEDQEQADGDLAETIAKATDSPEEATAKSTEDRAKSETAQTIEPPQGLVSTLQAEARKAEGGLVNGRGATNGTRMHDDRGAVNGRGLVNGKGLVNGRGLVNGTGMVNGTKGVGRASSRTHKKHAFLKRWQFVAILLVLFFVLPSFAYFYRSEESATRIDGLFDEWTYVPKFGMQTVSGVPELTVHEWAIQSMGTELYVYMKNEAEVMSSSDVESYYLFVDVDNDPLTGYSVSTIGADALLEMHGWDNEVAATSLSIYGSSDDQRNWSDWSRIDSLSFALKSDRLEAMAHMSAVIDDDARFLLVAQNNREDSLSTMSYPVPAKGGALIIRQRPGADISPSDGAIQKSINTSFLTLVLSCEGEPGTINSITPVVSGATLVSTFAGISLTPGEERTMNVVVDSSAGNPSDLVSAVVTESVVDSTFREVVILGEGAKAYVTSPPVSVQIDGAFGDWTGRTSVDDDSLPVNDPNIDINASGCADLTSEVAFYVGVKGHIYQGFCAPMTRTRPSGDDGGGGYVVPARKTGEDSLRIFIDSDMSNSTGIPIAVFDKLIGADFLVEIAGMNGRIVSKSILRYVGAAWVTSSANVTVQKDSQQLELSVPTANIGGDASFKVVFETTNWRDRNDMAVVSGQPDPWAITSTGSTYSSATGSSWDSLGAPALMAGDTIVDLATNPSRNIVYAVTNSGRTYRWAVGTSSSWSGSLTDPIGGTANVVAITAYADAGVFILTADGRPFYDADTTTMRTWTARTAIPGGRADFVDLVWRSGSTESTANLYALRATQNTKLLFTTNGGLTAFVQIGGGPGKGSIQAQLAVIPGAAQTQDQLFLLRENGNIRYSGNGAASWSARGNLPAPGTGNTSRYTEISIDVLSNVWVITDTGYCFESTDAALTFAYKGSVPSSPVTGIATPIPEFGMMPFVVICFMAVIVVAEEKRRKRES